MGYPYGLSFKAHAFESRSSLAKALQAALSSDYAVCSAEEMEMFAYDKEVSPLYVRLTKCILPQLLVSSLDLHIYRSAQTDPGLIGFSTVPANGP